MMPPVPLPSFQVVGNGAKQYCVQLTPQAVPAAALVFWGLYQAQGPWLLLQGCCQLCLCQLLLAS